MWDDTNKIVKNVFQFIVMSKCFTGKEVDCFCSFVCVCIVLFSSLFILLFLKFKAFYPWTRAWFWLLFLTFLPLQFISPLPFSLLLSSSLLFIFFSNLSCLLFSSHLYPLLSFFSLLFIFSLSLFFSVSLNKSPHQVLCGHRFAFWKYTQKWNM